jgi:hypothetical protein
VLGQVLFTRIRVQVVLSGQTEQGGNRDAKRYDAYAIQTKQLTSASEFTVIRVVLKVIDAGGAAML